MAAARINDIPEDAVIDILSRLPVKSLMRFRCVCKPWSGLFINQDFIAKHHDKQTALSNITTMIKHGDRQECFSLMSSTIEGDGDEIMVVKENIYIPFTKDFLYTAVILGPVNGLLCVSDHCDKIAIWNPSTRQFKPLPVSPIERPSGTETTMFGNLGFGFDKKTNDYKILRFVTNYFDDGMDSSDQVEIYSLNNDSWRQVPPVDVLTSGTPWSSPYNDGVYYWWADGDDGSLILSFDFADEVFDKIPLPDFGVSWDEYVPELGLYNGLLAVIIYTGEGLERLVDVWVMKEYGVKDSWAKQTSFGPILGVKKPLGFWKNGGLFLEDQEGQLVLYDPNTQQLKNLNVRGEESTFQVVNYVESMVPINGRREDEDEPFVRTQVQNLAS